MAIKRSSLQKRVSKFTPKIIRSTPGDALLALSTTNPGMVGLNPDKNLKTTY